MRHPWFNRLVLPAGVLIAYFSAPMSQDAPLGVVTGSLLAAGGLGLVAYVVIDEVRRSQKRLRPIHMLILVELAVVAFSWMAYALATYHPGEFVGLETRLDALYFAMTTLSTVGYGDVSAAGQLARGLVLVQLVFNLAFIAVLAGMFKEQMQEARNRRSE